MLSSNYNQNFQNSFLKPQHQQLQQQQQNRTFINSLESDSSVNSSSLLKAANTITFNSSPQSIASPFSVKGSLETNKILLHGELDKNVLYKQSIAKSFQNNLSKPQTSTGSFSKTLYELKQSSNQGDLDFDLHYPDANISNQHHYDDQLKNKFMRDETDLNNNFIGNKASTDKLADDIYFDLNYDTNHNLDEVIFKDDNDDDDHEADTDDLEIYEDDINQELSSNTSFNYDSKNKSFPSTSKMINSPANVKILDNRIGLLHKTNDDKTGGDVMIIPRNNVNVSENKIILNNSKINDTDPNPSTLKRISFLDQNDLSNELSPINSLTFTGTSMTPTSNLNDATPQNSVSNKYTISRSLMKLQLMKQQTEQIEKKAAALNTSGFSISSSTSTIGNPQPTTLITKNDFFHPNSTNEINCSNNAPISFNDLNIIGQKNQTNIPSSLPSSEIIPKNILSQVYQIETKLECPTKYHVMQIAKNLQQPATTAVKNQNQIATQNANKKIRKRASNSRLNSKSNQFDQQQVNQQSNINIAYNSGEANSLASSGDICVLANVSSVNSDYMFTDNPSSRQSMDSQNSNLEFYGMSSPSSSSFSQADYLDEIDDLVPDEINSFLNRRALSSNLSESDFQQEMDRLESSLTSPKTLPTEGFMNIINPSLGPSVRPSTSCPADMARLKKLQGFNLTDEEIKLLVKDRQKKDNHNMVERRRRFNINDRIKELGTILPKSNQGEIKQNKGSILKASVDYIKNLQYELNRSKELADKFRQMTLINKRLINRIKELELKATQTNSNPELNQSNSIVIQEDSNIKKEPSITLLNLISESVPNEQFKNINLMSPQINTNDDKKFLVQNTDLAQMEQLQQQQQQQHLQQQLQQHQMQNQINFNNLFNNPSTSNFNVQNNGANFTNDITELLSLDEILNSPINYSKNDPLLSNHIFGENLMDSLN